MKLSSRLAKRFFKYAISKGFLNKILDLIPRVSIWEYIGPELKSEFARFAGDGYDNLLYSGHNLTREDTVVVLGGYKGKSIDIWRERYNCRVVAYEPIPEFFEFIAKRFSGDPKVSLINSAVSDKDDEIVLTLADYGTSQFSNSDNKVIVKSKDIFHELNQIHPYPQVLEINIEGGEYAVLQRMIETSSICGIKTLLIQFHNYGYEQEYERARIRMDLSKTHYCEFNYDWIWEKWVLI